MDDSTARIVKRYARRVGLDPASYAGHSLRLGFLTTAAESGASIWKLSQCPHRCRWHIPSPIEVTRPNIVELRGSRCRRRAPCRQGRGVKARATPGKRHGNASSRLVSDTKEVTVRGSPTDPPPRRDALKSDREATPGYRLSSAQVPMAIQAIPANFSGHPAAAFSLCPLMLQETVQNLGVVSLGRR